MIHDISEFEAAKVAEQIIENGCDVTIKQLVISICRFTLSDYMAYDIQGLKVFEHKELFPKQNVRRKLEQWLKNVPDKDLEGIERMYVFADDGRNSWGSYMPILHNINLVWENPFSSRNPLTWISLLNVEHTLYHEIGHYVHRHTFGQEPEQENQANAYARRLMRISHPVFSKIAYSINKSLVLLGLKKKEETVV